MSKELKMFSEIHADRYVELCQTKIDQEGDFARLVVSNGLNDCTLFLTADQLTTLGNVARDLAAMLKELSMKSVKYKNVEYKVPPEVKWIATDKSGVVWGFQSKPKPYLKEWVMTDFDVNARIYLIKRGQTMCNNWKESLEEV